VSIAPLPPIIDATSLARQVDAKARAAAAGEIAGPAEENNVTDDSAADGRLPWQRSRQHNEGSPASSPASRSVEPSSGSQIDVMA
jgi:hypothetical protein